MDAATGNSERLPSTFSQRRYQRDFSVDDRQHHISKQTTVYFILIAYLYSIHAAAAAAVGSGCQRSSISRSQKAFLFVEATTYLASISHRVEMPAAGGRPRNAPELISREWLELCISYN